MVSVVRGGARGAAALNRAFSVLRLKAIVSRLFVAVTLPDPVRAKLADLQREIKQVLPPESASWTRPGNMHLTLRFLGKVASSRIPELSEKLSRALAGFGDLDLVCEGSGCFPDLHAPRVIWAGVHGAEERLLQLHRRVDEAVAGFAQQPAEAAFVGHITLARFKSIPRSTAEQTARFVEAAAARRFGGWRVPPVSLIHSQRSPAGTSYAERLSANLT